MNSRELYTEIGNIDDDLIIAAECYKKNRSGTIFYRIAGIAACICFIFFGFLFASGMDRIYINEIPEPAATKETIPNDENAVILPMNYSELLDYYGTDDFSLIFDRRAMFREQTEYVIYKDKKGNILQDTNTVCFMNSDESKTVFVTLSKSEKSFGKIHDARHSIINGTPMIIISYFENNGEKVYSAELELINVSAVITAKGFSEDEFIETVKELIIAID